MIFPFATVNDTGGAPWALNITANFRKNLETALIVYSGARGKLIHEKTRSRKSRDTVPLSDQQIDISSSRIYFKEKGILKVDSEIIYYSCRKNYGCANQTEKIVHAMIFFVKTKKHFSLLFFKQANKMCRTFKKSGF